MRDRFAIYVGRIDENKGCAELFEFFEHYRASLVDGHAPGADRHAASSRFPKHPRIHHLGFVDDQDKFDAMAAAELLIMPSYFESLSMVALEAWALGQARARQRQVRRAAGPVHPQQRRAVLRELRGVRRDAAGDRRQRRACRPRSAATAAQFFEQHYSWPVIEQKYLDMLRAAVEANRRPNDGAAARMVRAAPGARSRRPTTSSQACRRAPSPTSRDGTGASGEQAAHRPVAAGESAGRRSIGAGRSTEPPAATAAPSCAKRTGDRYRRDAIALRDGQHRRGGNNRGASRGRPPRPGRPAHRGRRRATAAARRRIGTVTERAAVPSALRRRRQRRGESRQGRRRPRGRRRRQRRAVAMPAVHQVLATLGYGDAIGHEVLGIQRVLREAGYESEIFVETADPRLEDLTVDYRELPDASHPDNILIHHFSIGSRASRMAYALPDRMVLVYHNITPPEYFVDVTQLLVQLCFLGRRELGLYRQALRARARRLRIQPPGARSARLPAHRRAAGGARTSRTCAGPPTTCRPARSTTTGSTCCSSAG